MREASRASSSGACLQSQESVAVSTHVESPAGASAPAEGHRDRAARTRTRVPNGAVTMIKRSREVRAC